MARQLPAITIVRAYDVANRHLGLRVLVDRLWPRGIKKEQLELDLWAKELAPSTQLRQWFGHRPERWMEFKRRYRAQLRSSAAAVEHLLTLAANRRVALLYGARDEEHNHALVLRQYLERKRAAGRSRK